MTENTRQAYLREPKHFTTFAAARGIADPGGRQQYGCAGLSDGAQDRRTFQVDGQPQAGIAKDLLSISAAHPCNRGEPDGSNQITACREKRDSISDAGGDRAAFGAAGRYDPKGKRDRAILELLYATGIRASELIEMQLDDINVRMGFVKCAGTHGSARIIPIGRPCRRAMDTYIAEVRALLLKGQESEMLFLNYAGKPFTRQGLWKILKEYGETAGFDIPLTPQVIRNSFAVHMLQNGADVKSLQELMGHEDISATQAYLAVVKNRIKDVYDKTHPRA